MITLKNIKVNGNLASADFKKDESYVAHIEVNYITKDVLLCDNEKVTYSDLMRSINKIKEEIMLNGAKKLPKVISFEWY